MKKTNKKPHALFYTCISMIAVAAVLITGMIFAFHSYEKGLLEVCADEQDGYVQLVVDQIQLNSERSNDEIIRDILDTLDSSSGRYWTFSENENILFVKDVLETDKYKDVSADTYYNSDSAREFLHDLSDQTIRHDEIEIGGTRYIASGTSFQYQNQTYRLVLLINETIFLDNNVYLGARISLITIAGIGIVLMVIVPMVLAWSNDKAQRKLNETEEDNIELRQKLMTSGERNLLKQLYTDEGGVWDISLEEMCLNKLKKRGVPQAAVAVFRFADESEKNDFLRNGSRMIQSKFLYFGDQNELDLLFVNKSAPAIREKLKPVEKNLKEIRIYDLRGGKNEPDAVSNL